MPLISHKGIDYDSTNIQVQDNASATDLDNTKIPTGQTVESYIGNKLKVSTKQYTNQSTNLYGNINIDLRPDSSIILAATCSASGNYKALIYATGSPAVYVLRWFNVATTSTASLVSTSLGTITVYYLSLS